MIRKLWILCLFLPLAAGAQDFCSNANMSPTTPTAAFEINPDGTVTDRRTGLMWVRCSVGQSGPLCVGTPEALPWDLALQRAETFVLAGYDDWRLPTRGELASLIEHCRFGPAINTVVFPNAQPALYWTSTPRARAAGQAWAVVFVSGEAVPVNATSGNLVLLVRTPERVYQVGETGPAGGTIVYDKGDSTDGWRYLEAAPKVWYGAPDPWAKWGCEGTLVGTTATAIGHGPQNTQTLVDAGCSTAAKLAAEAVINGYADWFLPTRDELVAMHDVLAVGTNFLDDNGLQPMSYASSSELSEISGIAIDFAGGGSEVQVHKGIATVVVRPMRRF